MEVAAYKGADITSIHILVPRSMPQMPLPQPATSVTGPWGLSCSDSWAACDAKRGTLCWTSSPRRGDQLAGLSAQDSLRHGSCFAIEGGQMKSWASSWTRNPVIHS